MSNSFNHQSFLKAGAEKEQKFANLLVLRNGEVISHSDRSTDIKDHIDLFWTKDNKTFSFDVKGLKKSNRSDINTDSSIHWIEISNVRGNPGWLYGKADYIAFETDKEWLLVKRRKLIDLINSKVTDTAVKNTKELYTYYQRYGKKDIIVKVLTKDLAEIASKTISKWEN